MRVAQAPGSTLVLGGQQLVGPGAEAGLILDRDTEHVGNDHRREGIDDRLDQVDRAGPGVGDQRPLDQPAGLGPDERLLLGRAVGGDNGVDHPSDASVPRLGDGRDHDVVLVERARVDERAHELLDVAQSRFHSVGGGDIPAGVGLDDAATRPHRGHRRVARLGAGRVRVEPLAWSFARGRHRWRD